MKGKEGGSKKTRDFHPRMLFTGAPENCWLALFRTVCARLIVFKGETKKESQIARPGRNNDALKRGPGRGDSEGKGSSLVSALEDGKRAKAEPQPSVPHQSSPQSSELGTLLREALLRSEWWSSVDRGPSSTFLKE